MPNVSKFPRVTYKEFGCCIDAVSLNSKPPYLPEPCCFDDGMGREARWRIILARHEDKPKAAQIEPLKDSLR